MNGPGHTPEAERLLSDKISAPIPLQGPDAHSPPLQRVTARTHLPESDTESIQGISGLVRQSELNHRQR